uniref:Uncharacterized protein n=1 Tax=Pristionchus pacificus TaxID=54126 RepID=A0A2A6CXV4_PRIPA|eukprot:PDM83054.1 hypothetical protein PRIPAC_37447 [Pristionchus pacificus]
MAVWKPSPAWYNFVLPPPLRRLVGFGRRIRAQESDGWRDNFVADYASFARIPARGQDKIACKMKRTSTLQASREAVIDHAKSRDVRNTQHRERVLQPIPFPPPSLLLLTHSFSHTHHTLPKRSHKRTSGWGAVQSRRLGKYHNR